MRIKDIQYENYQDYKKPSMFICACFCDWKCCKETKIDISVCQNNSLAKQKNFTIDDNLIIKNYLKNPLTSSIVFGGLEPFLQIKEIYSFIKLLRNTYKNNDDIVVYTGYYPKEVNKYIEMLKQFPNIIIKFGRYVPNSNSIYDEVLGIKLISDNQFAIKIS